MVQRVQQCGWLNPIRGWVVLALLLVTTQVHARSVQFGPAQVSLDVTASFTLYEDATTELGLEDYLSEPIHQQRADLSEDIVGFGLTKAALWFETEITSRWAKAVETVLEIRPGYLNYVDVWVLQGMEVIAHYPMGSIRPYKDRPMPHRHWLVPLSLEPGAQLRVIIRTNSKTDTWFGAVLYEEAEFYRADALETLVWGGFFGLVLVMALYNFFLFISIRNVTYLYYCIFVLCLGFGRAMERSFTDQFLNPDLAILEWIYPATLSLTIVSLTLFTRSFLGLRKWLPRFDRALLGLGFSVGVAALGLFSMSKTVGELFFFMGGLLIVFCLMAAVKRVGQGSFEARYYLAAFSFFLFAGLLVCISVVWAGSGMGDAGAGLSVGIALMVVMLSLALGRQIKTLQDENLEIQKEATDNLQARVEERTHELRLKTLEAQEATLEAVTAQEDSERLRLEAERAKDDAQRLEKRALEDAEKLRELDKEKTRFFQNISHELRTPLTLILHPLEQAGNEYTGDERIELASRNARRLLRLVNQLLDFQKLEAGKKRVELTPVALSKFVRVCGDYFASACSSKDVTFELALPEVDHQDVFIMGEVDSLEKVAFNYLSNALKFTPRGGRIEFGVELDRSVASSAKLFVRDTGPGISAEGQSKLFQVFSQVDESTTREYEGTGLGLALVKSLTEEMGGAVGVESEVGKGTTFYAVFEAMERPEGYLEGEPFEVREWLVAEEHTKSGETTEVEPQPAWSGQGERVLVVDDLADMRAMIAGVLSTHGLQVMTAPHGQRGLELAQAHRPDLIVTDWMMPVMAGPDLIQSIRRDEVLRATPVVLLTAKSDEESKLAGAGMGADAFLGKPFNEQELLCTVRNLLALKSREREVELLNHRITEQVLKRYLPPDLVEKIVHGDAALVQEPKSVTATILFSDLKGFTEFSAEVRAPKLARILNEYLSAMTEVIFAHGGTIDKFVGDAIMVIFGAPTELPSREQAEQAARCALAMQRCMAKLNQRWRDTDNLSLSMRIGLHQGPVVVGSFGSEIRSDYTAIGPTVNLASRIESVCDPGAVLVSGEVCDFLPEAMSESAGSFELKGIGGVRTLYRLQPEENN